MPVSFRSNKNWNHSMANNSINKYRLIASREKLILCTIDFHGSEIRQRIFDVNLSGREPKSNNIRKNARD